MHAIRPIIFRTRASQARKHQAQKPQEIGVSRFARAHAASMIVACLVLAACAGSPEPDRDTVSRAPNTGGTTSTISPAPQTAPVGTAPTSIFSDRNQPLTPNDTRPNSFDPNIEAGLDAGLDTGLDTGLGAGLATVLDAQSFNVPPRPAGAITISLLLPLGSANDDVRALAEALLQAAQLALFDVGRSDLLLQVKDTKGTPAGAQMAARAALVSGTDIIIGPLFATSVQAIAPVLANTNVPALALSNDRSVASRNIWLLGFIPEDNIDRAVAQTIGQGLTRFGALLPEGTYGTRLGQTLSERISRYGGELVQVEIYPPDAPGMFEPVKRLAQYETRRNAHSDEMARLEQEAALLAPPDTPSEKLFEAIRDTAPELVSKYETLKRVETLGEIPYDAVFMPEGGLALRNLAPLLPYFDVDPRRVKFVGTGLWDDPKLGQEPPLHGGWYAAPDMQLWRKFSDHYTANFQTRPARLASIAYDAVGLAARLSAVHGRDPFRLETLTDPNGFVGIDGILRLTPDGLAERGLAVHEIQRKKTVLISPAPTSFVERDRRMQAALALAASLQNQRRAAPGDMMMPGQGDPSQNAVPFSTNANPPAPRQ